MDTGSFPATSPRPGCRWRVYVFGFEHLWFLQAIFLVFLVVGLLEMSGALGSSSGWVATFTVSVGALAVLRVPSRLDFFSINEAVYLLPFFLLGYRLCQARGTEIPAARNVVTGVFAAVFAARLLMLFDLWTPPTALAASVRILVGMTGVVCLYLWRRQVQNPFLVWLGPFSFGVYLLHPFGAAASRMGLSLLGVHLSAIVFAVALTAGLLAPIAFQVVFRHSNAVRTLILGERSARRLAPAR